METFGYKLIQKIFSAKGIIFLQGEFTQLTFQAFEKYVDYIKNHEESEIPIIYPIGFRIDNTPILSEYKYSKHDLFKRYQYLGQTQLPINTIYQLVTQLESLFVDLLRLVLIEFPQKIPNKKKFDYELILNSNSIEEAKLNLVNSVLNEVTYKSPKDFAEEFKNYVGINLLEKPVFLNYIELKATRDIHIHNQGIVNEIYLGKSGSLARAKNGEWLDVDTKYFLQSYEYCIQITEFLETEINKIWPSPYFSERMRIKSQEGKTNAEIVAEVLAMEEKYKDDNLEK